MKTSELSGAALDWAVAKCEKETFVHGQYEHSSADNTIWARGGASVEKRFSVDWAYGGPIIEREKIALGWESYDLPEPTLGCWVATVHTPPQGCRQEIGPTPLIAAMRCFVASKLGNEVEVPEELLS